MNLRASPYIDRLLSERANQAKVLSNKSNRTSKKHESIDREKVDNTLDQVANDAFALAEQINPL